MLYMYLLVFIFLFIFGVFFLSLSLYFMIYDYMIFMDWEILMINSFNICMSMIFDYFNF